MPKYVVDAYTASVFLTKVLRQYRINAISGDAMRHTVYEIYKRFGDMWTNCRLDGVVLEPSKKHNLSIRFV